MKIPPHVYEIISWLGLSNVTSDWSQDCLNVVFYLSGGEGLAHGADGLSVLIGLLLHLQQLRSLDQRLQGLLGSACHQTFVPEPLLQLAHIVPTHTHTR